MTPGPHRKNGNSFSRLDMYFGGNNHGCQEYSKNVYKYTQADRLNSTNDNNALLLELLKAATDGRHSHVVVQEQ